MNKAASLAQTTPPAPEQHPISSSTRSSVTPAIIPLDYSYQNMSPSTHSTHLHHHTAQPCLTRNNVNINIDVDTQYSSLFGDPVPPPPKDYYATHLESAQLIRPASIDISSDEKLPFGQTVTLDTDHGQMRLFSAVPYNSSITRRFSNANTQDQFDILPTVIPRLQPPDIQILPNSSGGSSSEPRDSPNYSLLTPDDILRKPSLYDINEPPDISKVTETMTITDVSGSRENSEATRRVSNFSHFKSNTGVLNKSVAITSPVLPTKSCTRQCSNESYSSSEWFRPVTHDFPEFRKMPCLRPSSKNVMSIKRVEMPMHHSPIAAMINNSNCSSSSGEERLMDTTQVLPHPTVSLDILAPARPPEPSHIYLRDMKINLAPQQYLKDRSKSTLDTTTLGPIFSPTPSTAPPPVPPAPIAPHTVELRKAIATKREMSPVIIKDLVATGSDYRVQQPRLHKKTSFTIISNKSPQSSRAQSSTSIPSMRQDITSLTQYMKDQTTKSSSSTKPSAKAEYNLQCKGLTPTQLHLSHFQNKEQQPQYHLLCDDSPRPSVQFNMSSRYSQSKMPQKGILQHRESLTSSQDTLPTPRVPALPPIGLSNSYKIKSCEALPLTTDPYCTAIPRLNRSSFDLRMESKDISQGALPRPLKFNSNPTRKQKGLIRVINSADSMTRIPLHYSWSSMDDLKMERDWKPPFPILSTFSNRRRSSSSSPERKSSTITASDRRSSNLSTITTSDFSFRRPSVTAQSQRRNSNFSAMTTTVNRKQSLIAPRTLVLPNRGLRNKIVKPTTLSPILGTPNKESSSAQSLATEAAQFIGNSEGTMSGMTSRRDSLSKIPVRSLINSLSNSHVSSCAGSLTNFHSNSPFKEFTTSQLPLADFMQGSVSRSSSRAKVHIKSQSNSRANSRVPSRSTSRASTRPISQGPSRTSSRPNSRMEQAKELANSRSNSRMSPRSALIGGSVSPNVERKHTSTPTRRKATSLSPKAKNRVILAGSSLSLTSKAHANKRSQVKATGKKLEEQRSLRSRIPMRAIESQLTLGKSNSSKNSETQGLKKTALMKNNVTQHNQLASAKKAPVSVRKPESSVRRTPSSVGKQATSVKKQPSNLPKAGNNLKSTAISLQKKAKKKEIMGKSDKREMSTSLSIKKVVTAKGEIKKSPLRKPIERAMESKKGANTSKTVKTAVKNVQSSVITESVTDDIAKEVMGEMVTTISTTIPTPTTATSGIIRHPSKISLVRMGSRISLLSKKRLDSNPTKKISEATKEETTTPTSDDSADTLTSLHPQLHEVNNAGQLLAGELSTAILEKSQKILQNVQKVVTHTTDEIQKPIIINLTDFKSLESNMGKMSDSSASPTLSVATVKENSTAKPNESISRVGTADIPTGKSPATQSVIGSTQNSPLPPTQPIEADVSVINTNIATRNGTTSNAAANDAAAKLHAGHGDATERVSARAISVLPEVDCESANFQNCEFDVDHKTTGVVIPDLSALDGSGDVIAAPSSGGSAFKTDSKRRSPDGQGGSTAGSCDK